jgi:hypothetical protein
MDDEPVVDVLDARHMRGLAEQPLRRGGIAELGIEATIVGQIVP